MSPCSSNLEQQLSSIMDVLSKAAVSEISKLFSEGSASLRLQVTKSLTENEALRTTMNVMRNELFSLRLQIKSDAASMVNGLQPLNNLKAVGGPPSHPPPPDCEPSSVKTPAEKTPDIILIKEEEDMGGGSPAGKGVDSGDRSTPCGATSNMSAHSEELRILSVYGRGEGPLARYGHDTLFAASELETLRHSPTHNILLSSNSGPSERVPALDGLQAAALSLEDAAPEAEDPGREPVPLSTLSPLQPCVCVQCGKLFTTNGALTIHLRSHSGEKPCVCGQCGRRFINNSGLMSHQKTHSVGKSWVCVECEKCFTRNSGLKIHLKTHSGEKPWACVQCGKRFTRKCNLKIHLRTHSGEKPCVCLHCDARFSDPNQLRRHLKACRQRTILTHSAGKL